MTYAIVKRIEFCYGHRLMNYVGKCRNLHGHNATAEIVLETNELDELSMVVDFGEVKRKLKDWIESEIDHKLVLNEKDPLLETLKAAGEPIFTTKENPTAEHMARVLFEKAKSQGFPVVEVRLWETPTSQAIYRP